MQAQINGELSMNDHIPMLLRKLLKHRSKPFTLMMLAMLRFYETKKTYPNPEQTYRIQQTYTIQLMLLITLKMFKPYETLILPVM